MALKINFNDIRKANIHKKKKERRDEGERCCCADDVTDIKIESFTHFLSNIFICIKSQFRFNCYYSTTTTEKGKMYNGKRDRV